MVKKLLGRSRRYFLNKLDRPAVILLYHRVTTLEKDPQMLSVHPKNFHDQVDFLKKEYSLMYAEEFADLIFQNKPLPARTVVLSFDDGYADNYLEALPILESLKAQALFYVATDYIGTNKELWWDELERILLAEKFPLPQIEVGSGKQDFILDTSTLELRSKAYETLHPFLKYSLPGERDKVMTDLRKEAGLSADGRTTHRLMTREEVRILAGSPSAIIGAHTHRHPALAMLDRTQQKEEIEKSKTILEGITGKSVEHFSYPYGSKIDYDANTVDIMREMEFKMVCANFYGQVHTWSDRLQLPRILARDWKKEEFRNNIENFFRS
jgi:peptidoglycan/xylan/chitin deacetylase (PgdA/CDA1 family)